jgi:hypothetical protein
MARTTFSLWKDMIGTIADSYIDGVVRGEANEAEASEGMSDKVDEVNENITNLRRGWISPETFRVIMTALGYSQGSIEEIMRDITSSGFIPHFGGNISGEQFNQVQQQVNRAMELFDYDPANYGEDNTSAPVEPVRPRTRAECIKVRSQEEKRVVDNSKGKRRRKKGI